MRVTSQAISLRDSRTSESRMKESCMRVTSQMRESRMGVTSLAVSVDSPRDSRMNESRMRAHTLSERWDHEESHVTNMLGT